MQDPQQTQQAVNQMMAGMGAFFIIFGLIGLAIWLFSIFLYWRMFTKAGMPGALGLIAIIPSLGWIVCNCILAFGDWKVVPAAPAYGGYPPQPPTYPPANYPPTYPPQGS